MLFCGSRITQLKTTKQPISGKIIVSTCYFPNYLHDFDKGDWDDSKSLNYINELIANIETFEMKVARYTSKPDKWVYRIYIDETIFNLEKIINNVIPHDEVKNKKNTKKHRRRRGRLIYHKSLRNKTNNNLINELDSYATAIRSNIINTYDILLFISKLMRKYIDMILASKDSRYDNIEIMTYSNPDLQIHLETNPDKIISGMIATYGTLMRFHPCLDKDAHAVIMRNCSHNLTPLDLIIQNYWLEAVPELEFMEYVNITYDFTANRNLRMRQQWYKTFFDSASNTKHTKANKIRHFGYDRVMAGLISAKLNSDGYNTSAHYSQVFTKLYSKMQESLSSNSNIFRMIDSDSLYTYGVDEAVINFIFPELRSGSYRHRDVKNPSGLERKTFALELMNGNASTCHKCDKKEFESLLDDTLGKPNNKSESASGSSVSKSSTEKKAKPICCLNDIYMRDTGFYNLQYKITNFFNLGWILSSLRALPFYKLKMNNWNVPMLTFGNVLEGIMFINKYTFALRDKSNIPRRVKRTEQTQESAFSNSKEDKSIEHDQKKEPDEKKQSNKPKITRKIDKHLVLCNVRNANLDNEIEKYLAGVRIAYARENFYPILIYPSRLNILSYYPEDKKTQKTISIHKMLELVKHRHGFIL
jgi:hypothetical protein